MSFVFVSPSPVAAAASELAGIDSVISTANQAAAAATTQVLGAAGDEVSVAIAALFAAHVWPTAAATAVQEEPPLAEPPRAPPAPPGTP